MNKTDLGIYKIKQKLSKVPEERLNEVNDFIEFILMKSKKGGSTIIKFEGIRKGLGFKNINDLESEIRQLRKETTESIQRRVTKLST